MHVLVADRHPVFRAGLRALVEATADLELVGEAATLQEAAPLAGRLRPDVVVVDALPNGELRRCAPNAAVLVLDVSQTPESVRDALRQGVRGYAERCCPADDLVQAIRFVAQGAAVFSAAAATQLVELAAPRPRPFPQLTERELEVLALLAGGAGNGETARRLGLTTKTVRNHVSRICTKLQVLDRAHAVLKAREAGLGHSFAEASSTPPPRSWASASAAF